MEVLKWKNISLLNITAAREDQVLTAEEQKAKLLKEHEVMLEREREAEEKEVEARVQEIINQLEEIKQRIIDKKSGSIEALMKFFSVIGHKNLDSTIENIEHNVDIELKAIKASLFLERFKERLDFVIKVYARNYAEDKVHYAKTGKNWNGVKMTQKDMERLDLKFSNKIKELNSLAE